MKKICILMGSPRKNGNTAAMLEPFTSVLEAKGAETETIWLYDRELKPCIACRNCQKDYTKFDVSTETICKKYLIRFFQRI